MADEASRRAQLRDKTLLAGLYTSFFGLVFLIALYWTFPYDRLRDYVVAKLSTDDAIATRTVEIGELEPVGIGGLRISDLEITQLAKKPDAQPATLHLSSVSADLSLWSLLIGNKKLTLSAKAGGGTLDGKYLQTSDTQHIEAELNGFDIGALGVGSFMGLPIKGKATGTIDVLVAADVIKSTGSVKLDVKNLKVGDGKAKIRPPGLGTGLTLDEIDAGKLALAIDLHDGVANITRFATDGRDLKMSGKGSIHLSDPLKRSRPDLDLYLTFSDVYNNNRDRTKAMFEILQMRPEWQRATTPDGTMRVHLGGTFVSIRGGPGR
jgi:type II secretion system protein N